MKQAPLPTSRAQLALQGLYCAFLRPGNRTGFIPPNKKSRPPCKPIFLTPHPRRSCTQSRSSLFTALGYNTSYMKHLEHSSSMHWRQHVLYEAPGAWLPPLRAQSLEIQLNRGLLCLPQHPGDRTSPTHLTKFGSMALIPFVRTRTPSQKTSMLGGVAQILKNPKASPCLADVVLFVQLKFPTTPLE